MPEIKNINDERIRKIDERMQEIEKTLEPFEKAYGMLEQDGTPSMKGFSCMFEDGEGVSELDQKRLKKQFENTDLVTAIQNLKLKMELMELRKEKLQLLGKYEGSTLQNILEVHMDMSRYLPKVIDGRKEE